MTIQRTIYGFRFVEIERGDTLQRIAAREMGDASRWPDLVSYNSLVPPFVTDDAAAVGPGVLLSGQFIRVPASTAVASAEASPDEVFGRDVALDGGALSIVNGDFGVAGGRDNLRQALRNRLDTERGELVFHRDYGSMLRRLVGTVNGPTASLLASQYTRTTVLADPRIASVSKALASVVGDSIRVDVEAAPFAGKAIDVTSTI